MGSHFLFVIPIPTNIDPKKHLWTRILHSLPAEDARFCNSELIFGMLEICLTYSHRVF